MKAKVELKAQVTSGDPVVEDPTDVPQEQSNEPGTPLLTEMSAEEKILFGTTDQDWDTIEKVLLSEALTSLVFIRTGSMAQLESIKSRWQHLNVALKKLEAQRAALRNVRKVGDRAEEAFAEFDEKWTNLYRTMQSGMMTAALNIIHAAYKENQ